METSDTASVMTLPTCPRGGSELYMTQNIYNQINVYSTEFLIIKYNLLKPLKRVIVGIMILKLL